MSFRAKMRVDPSIAEVQLLCALKVDPQLKQWIYFHDPLFLGMRNGRTWWCVPDFSWKQPYRLHWALPLDSPLHLKSHAQARDARIDKAIKKKPNWDVHRLLYNGKKLTPYRIKKLIVEVKEVVL